MEGERRDGGTAVREGEWRLGGLREGENSSYGRLL